ncbi:MAG: type II toxin-antitoxin system CcdA family antitoxin [bacterium]|nr:type II toxin-antitoxin system CcdA family antitoxin [bacterium]
MATIRTTITLDRAMAEQARDLRINISSAARAGVAASIKKALAEADREAYRRNPEQPDDFWDQAQAWSDA